MSKTFLEVYPTANDLYTAYTGEDTPHYIADDYKDVVESEFKNEVYNVLYGYYASRHITANEKGETQWKSRFLTAIGIFTPAYKRKLKIQKDLRTLSEDELRDTGKTVTNISSYPGDVLETEDEQLKSVDNQQRTGVIKGKVDAYGQLNAILKDDVVSAYVNRFNKFFTSVAIEELSNGQ